MAQFQSLRHLGGCSGCLDGTAKVVSRRTQYYERRWHSSKASATSVVVRGASTVLQVGYGRPGSMHLVAEGDGLVLR
ncbi:hypothetical protein CDAR_66151 [Caerostris darwini]|uniref:Uncharacterized protein n=1 Tax=Caerostris darwini TaxID=1538125 RepID=A0AAV4VWD0_9ARAC|nr:hypothetical protein CDAR_66151 [Caerostris darwini]